MGSHTDAATSDQVVFRVSLSPTSNFSVTLEFDVTVSLSGGSIQPGQTLGATASLLVPHEVSLSVKYLGLPVPLSIDPLGHLYDVGIPGVSYSYLGITLGLFLNLSSRIVANESVSGPGSGGGPLSWGSSGTQEFLITADSSAGPAATLTTTLSGIEYALAVGVDAKGAVPFLGNVTIPVVPVVSFGLFHSTPASVSSTYTTPGRPSLLSGSGGVLLFGLLAVGALAAAVVLALVLRNRRRKPAAATRPGSDPSDPAPSSSPGPGAGPGP